MTGVCRQSRAAKISALLSPLPLQAEALPAWTGGSSVQITPLTYKRERSTKPHFPTRLRSASVLEMEEMKEGTSRQPGTVWLQDLCHSGAQSKPPTSAPLSITGVQQDEAKGGALLPNKLLCDLTQPSRSMMLSFSLAMSITVMCGDPSPSMSQHVEHCGGLFFHKIFPLF